MNLNDQRINASINGFENIQYNIEEHFKHDNYNLNEILTTHSNSNDISYRLMVIPPSGQPHIHTHRRSDQTDQSFFTLPYWSYPRGTTQAYSVDQTQLLGWAVLPNKYEIYVQIIHPPLPIDLTHPSYWLPIITALILYIWGVYLNLVHKLAWQNLINYTNRFPKRLNEPYKPIKYTDFAVTQEFQRMVHSLNRINQQLNHLFRRTQNLTKRFNRLTDYSPLPMLVISRRGEINYFNRRFEQVFMAVFQEEVAFHLTDFLIGENKATQHILTNMAELKTSKTLNVSSLQDNIDYLLHLTPWTGKQGQVQGFCAQLTNVSTFTNELKDLHSQYQQQADRLVEFDKLWSVLGHELRTPLSGIIGLVDLMDTGNFNEDQLETYTTLKQTGQTMLTMLNDMLDVAKMEAGKLQVTIERTDVLSLSHQVADLMSSNARNNNIELLVYFDPQTPRYIDTDSGRIRQALMNLIGNAIKFTQNGYVALIVSKLDKQSKALIALADTTTHISEQKLDYNWLCFSVKDTGIGISKEDKSKLFTHFSQANESISRQFGGTGLGLAISNNFAQMLGGFINVESTLSKGSEFNLYLPLTQVTSQPIYHFNVDLSHICLITFSSQQISTSSLQELTDYLGLACLAYTGVNKADIEKISQMSFDDLSIVILVEEELYDNYDIEPIHTLSSDFKAPKILLSMTPENSIDKERRNKFDAYLAKPLMVNHLIKHLISLSDIDYDTKDENKNHFSKTQRAFDAFMKDLQSKSQNDPQSSTSLKDIDSAQKSSTIDDESKPDQQLLISNNQLGQKSTLIEANRSQNDGNLIQSTNKQRPLILIAEDNPINQKVACKVLEKLGYRYITADNGAEVLNALEEKGDDVSLILMDCRMPILDGFETTKKIRSTKNTIPIIALTANDTDNDREECLEAGMNGFLTKPIRKEKLVNILDKFMVY